MKLLFDQNLSFKLCEHLSDLFPGAQQTRLLGLDRSDDRSIWSFAAEHGYAIVTLDSDFAELAALYGFPPKVVWLRCGNQSTAQIELLVRKYHSDILKFLEDEQAACLELY